MISFRWLILASYFYLVLLPRCSLLKKFWGTSTPNRILWCDFHCLLSVFWFSLTCTLSKDDRGNGKGGWWLSIGLDFCFSYCLFRCVLGGFVFSYLIFESGPLHILFFSPTRLIISFRFNGTKPSTNLLCLDTTCIPQGHTMDMDFTHKKKWSIESHMTRYNAYFEVSGHHSHQSLYVNLDHFGLVCWVSWQLVFVYGWDVP